MNSELKVSTNLSVEERNFLEKQMIESNFLQVPTNEVDWYKEFSLAYKNPKGEVIAGLLGTKYYWGIAFLDLLWVNKEFRNQKLGTMLLSTFEGEAIEHKCRIIHLQTFSFQAPKFYEKHGYRQYGELIDMPEGHNLLCYFKFLKQTK